MRITQGNKAGKDYSDEGLQGDKVYVGMVPKCIGRVWSSHKRVGVMVGWHSRHSMVDKNKAITMNSIGTLTGTNQKVDGQRAKVKPMEHGKQANKVL